MSQLTLKQSNFLLSIFDYFWLKHCGKIKSIRQLILSNAEWFMLLYVQLPMKSGTFVIFI